MTHGPHIILPQSEGNTGDTEVLRRLLSTHPNLTRVETIRRLGGGYSSCRVYIAIPTFNLQAGQPWVIKLGPAAEIRAEANNFVVAESNIPSQNIASKIADYYDETNGVLLLRFANLDGRSPVDLENALRRPEGGDCFDTLVRLVSSFVRDHSWRTENASNQVREWLKPKLTNLTPAILGTTSSPVLYSPDFGQAFSNPAYYLQRDIRRLDVTTPISFTHGDLNLRNVLFGRDADGGIAWKTPILIDFRHAGDRQWAVTDLAKLEACLRYTWLEGFDDYGLVQQVTAFLTSSRGSLRLSPLPDFCEHPSLIMAWRCISQIRATAVGLTSPKPESEATYWLALASYGISAATYQQLTQAQRHLAYIDAAALLTKYLFPRSADGEQFTLPIHSSKSPPVRSAVAAQATETRTNLLRQDLAKGRGVLVVGPGYGRRAGVEPFSAFTQRLFLDVTGEEPPIASAPVLLEALQRLQPRPKIRKAIKARLKSVLSNSATDLPTARWAGVINYHFHDLPLQATVDSETPLLRIDNIDDAVRHCDLITGGRSFYLPFHGDIWTNENHLVLTSGDRRRKQQTLDVLARALEARQERLVLLFWQCEELSVEELVRIRDQFAAEMTVSIDTFFVSEQNDNSRDAALAALGIWRANISLDALADVTTPIAAPSVQQRTWHNASAQVFYLPALKTVTNGLLDYFTESLIPQIAQHREELHFLLGAPVHISDIEAGRVVQRTVLEEQLLPAVRGVLADDYRQAIVVTGRAGSGISTLLCACAHHFLREARYPVVFVDTSAAHSRSEWLEAGGVLADVSKAVREPVLVFLDASDSGFGDSALLVQGAAEAGGRVVPILGGRRDALVLKENENTRRMFYEHIQVSDKLATREWMSLARILQRNGFSVEQALAELADRLQRVGRLIPAIYEATDKKNRKFQEIIEYEFQRYGRDSLLQRAYRMICSIGALGVSITQYWLLRALGDRGMSDAARILGGLSEDIIVQTDRLETDGNVVIAPLHRVIADEVVRIATPDPHERLLDIERLIQTANLASEYQGMAVAKLLHSRGSLVTWARAQFASSAQYREKISRLYICAFDNKPLHPRVEIYIRQHFGLLLRKWSLHEEALKHLKIALLLDEDNSATEHILGLVHESRAVAAWERYGTNYDDRLLAAARSDERDAIEYFGQVRDRRPFQEHGYESEARYYRKKRLALQQGHFPSELVQESQFQVYQGLSLISEAERRVTKEALKESSKTKAYLLQLAGDLIKALEVLLRERNCCDDPVRRLRLTKAAATLAAEAGQWDTSVKLLDELIEQGERSAIVYLARDNALASQGVSARDRAIKFQESAEEYNRWDVETLVRWAELCLTQRRFDGAVSALRRADEVAQNDYSIFERDRVRGSLEENGQMVRLTGTVERLFRPGEGLIATKGVQKGLFFRVHSSVADLVRVGAQVSFGIGWRIRGLRAIDVQPKPSSHGSANK